MRALSSEISTSEILLSTKPKEGGPAGIGQVYLPPGQLQLLLGEGFHLAARQIQVPDEDAIEMPSIMSRIVQMQSMTLFSFKFMDMASKSVIDRSQ